MFHHTVLFWVGQRIPKNNKNYYFLKQLKFIRQVFLVFKVSYSEVGITIIFFFTDEEIKA